MRELLEQCRDCAQETFEPGAVLIQEGERTGRLFVLAEGELEVFRDEVEIALVDEPGAVFGEMAVLLDAPHTASVRASRRAVVHVIEDPAAFLASRPNVALPIAALLARRLQNVTDYLVDIKRQFADQQDHLAIVDEVLQSLTHEQAETFIPEENLPRDPTT